jgi:hypothetical protein
MNRLTDTAVQGIPQAEMPVVMKPEGSLLSWQNYALDCILSCPVQFTSQQTYLIRSILMFSFHLHLGFPADGSSLDVFQSNWVCISCFYHASLTYQL